MSQNDSSWFVLGGSALGGRHVNTGVPNQDSWESDTFVHRGQDFAVLAVADGHGGSRYVRSEVGSKLAVAVAVEVIGAAVEAGGFDGPSRKIEKEILSDLPAMLVAGWSQRCLEHLAGHPFTADEEERAGASLDADPLLSYGSTLLTAVLAPTRCFFLQVGDGDTLVALPDGEMIQPLPTDERLTGSETTSLCLPNADRDFRAAIVENPAPSLVLLSSDGYGVAFADPGWRRTVISDLVDQLKTRGPGRVTAALPGWLEESARVGGDDATLVIAYRPESTQAKSLARRRRGAPLVAAGVLGLVLGLTAGWMAAGLVTDPVAAVATPTTTTTELITTSTVGTTVTTVSSAPGVGGGVTTTEDELAFIVGADGTVVQFSPNPENAVPVVVVAAIPGKAPASIIYGWDAFWALEGGHLQSDGEPVELGLPPELRFTGIELENGLIWLLSEGGEWLVALEPWSTCDVIQIGTADLGTPSDVDVPECHLDDRGGG